MPLRLFCGRPHAGTLPPDSKHLPFYYQRSICTNADAQHRTPRNDNLIKVEVMDELLYWLGLHCNKVASECE